MYLYLKIHLKYRITFNLIVLSWFLGQLPNPVTHQIMLNQSTPHHANFLTFSISWWCLWSWRIIESCDHTEEQWRRLWVSFQNNQSSRLLCRRSLTPPSKKNRPSCACMPQQQDLTLVRKVFRGTKPNLTKAAVLGINWLTYYEIFRLAEEGERSEWTETGYYL